MDNKIRQVIEGVKNTVTPTPDVEALAAKRIVICRTCPEFRKDPNLKGAKAEYCNACGCDLFTKTRSTQTSCPKKKW